MTNNPYTVDDSALSVALGDALERLQRAEDRLALIACAHIAAAVRDVLTDHDPDTPFDAAHLRLIRQQGSHVLSTDGTYWNTSGEERRIEPSELIDGLLGWTNQLHEGNYPVWQPMCEQEEPTGQALSYRLDLAQAAQLPDEVNQSAMFAEIRSRLAAVTRALPWFAEEVVYDRGGGIVSDGHPEAVHTDFVVTDADDFRVAEIAVNYDGPDDTAAAAEHIAVSRADATLISHAPQDLKFLVTYLDHLCGGEDAEAMHLRGYCARCGTALYTSAVSEAPAALDGSTHCKGSPITSLAFPLHHYLRH